MVCFCARTVSHLCWKRVRRSRQLGEAGRQRGDAAVALRRRRKAPPLQALQVQQVLRQALRRLHLRSAQVVVRRPGRLLQEQ